MTSKRDLVQVRDSISMHAIDPIGLTLSLSPRQARLLFHALIPPNCLAEFDASATTLADPSATLIRKSDAARMDYLAIYGQIVDAAVIAESHVMTATAQEGIAPGSIRAALDDDGVSCYYGLASKDYQPTGAAALRAAGIPCED